jgi:Protein of unknown function (DUF835)
LGRDSIVNRRLFAAAFISLAFLLSFAASIAPAKAATNEFVPLLFDFVGTESSYAPGENFTVEFTVMNSYGNVSGYYYYLEVTNISAFFSWMGTGERILTDVTNTSVLLYPDDAQTFSVTYQVPENVTDKTYGYNFKATFVQWHTSWGYMGSDSTETILYHDLVVATPVENPEEQGFDYLPLLGVVALILAIGIIGALLYSRSGASKPRAAAAEAAPIEGAAPAAARPNEMPIISTSPNEGFPVERGFVYLVKEKRPGVAFAMFNEAVKHGAQGMVVTREHPNRLKQTHEFDAVKILWLTRRVGENHVDPTELIRLSMTVSKFIESTPRTVVLVEGLEYLITQNDFETVLRFVNHLHDFVLAHDCAVIIVLDPRVLSTRELALLERSARVVESGEFGVIKPERISETA